MINPRHISRSSLLITAASLCLFMGACGFQPLYHTPSSATSSAQITSVLANTEIGAIPDREGQYLRNALIDRFYSDGRPDSAQYILEVSPLKEQQTELDITRFSNATRGQLRISTTMTLRDKDTNEALISRSLQGITSYNILASEFSSRVSEDNARLNAIDNLAQQIETQLALYFRR